MKSFVRFLFSAGLVVAVLAIGLSAGIVLDRRILLPYSGMAVSAAADPAGSNTGLNEGLINEAFNIINRYYADQPAIKSKELTYGAISGMVDALGDTGHTRFLTPQMVKSEQTQMKGSFEGIGALMQEKDGHAVVVAPYDNSPAQKAGIKPGDIFIKVNGEDVTGMSLNEVVSRVLGPAGTPVTLTIQDPKTGDIREVKIIRAKIDLHNLTWQMLPGTTIAHVRLAGFSENVTAEMKKAINDAQSQGATGIILDLRNNPGGLLDEAVGVTSLYVSKGNVLLEKDAQGNVKEVPVLAGRKVTDLPVVVLINQGSASASEIVSGALQDAGRAKLVGETTFGTGTVLNMFPLSDQSALLLAVQQWLTPNGRVIWHQGIKPDITVTLDPNAQILTPETERGLTAEELQASQDTQVLKALEMLQAK